ATASMGRKCCTTSVSACRPVRSSASSAPRGRAKVHWPSSPNGSTCRRAGACWSTASTLPWSTPLGCGGNWALCCKKTCCSTARYATTSRSPTQPCRSSRSLRQRGSPGRMSSSWSCRKATTPLSASGSSLSGGQKQRIAIARALVTNPRILIFDEATSALDYESERVIQQNMQEIAKGRTVFIIAHRLSTVRRTDRIITIDAGRVVEDGSHDDLTKPGGRYAPPRRLQAGIHEVG